MDRSNREIVYCHECHNEWYKDEHDLKCPRCASEFTEVIESGHDPRASDSPTGFETLRGHNPWDAPDPDEDDIDNLTGGSRTDGMSGGFPPGGRPGASGSSGRNSPRSPRGPPEYAAIFSDFTSMLHQILGDSRQRAQPEEDITHQSHLNTVEPEDMPGFRPRGGGGMVLGMPPGPFRPSSAPGTRTIHTSTGPGSSTRIEFQYSSGGSTRSGGFHSTFVSGNRGAPVPMDGADIHDLLGQLFGAPPTANAPPDARGGGGGGLAEILSRMVGNLHGQSAGNFVHTDREMEDIISQLMDQQGRGNAPAPASTEAIASLPKRPADRQLFDGEEKGSCPVCMEDVEVGVVVQVLPCNHWFHPECSKAWLEQHDTCPICRAGIMPKEGDRNRARGPAQEPLHNEDPVQVLERQNTARRESTRQPSFGRPPSRPQHDPNLWPPVEGADDPVFRRASSSSRSSPQLSRNAAGQRSSRSRGRNGSGASGDDVSIRSRFTNWFSGGQSGQRRRS